MESNESLGQMPIFSDYAMDFKTGKMLLKKGQLIPVFGQEALRVWVFKALHPDSERFAFSAHSADYGNELFGITGKSPHAIESRVRAMIEDCLLVNPYIKSVESFAMKQQGERILASFSVSTVYGNIDYEREVE